MTSRQTIQLIFKITVTLLCLWYVGQKIEWSQTWRLLLQSQKGWLVVAAILFIASKALSAVRLNYYFRNIHIGLSEADNLRLYWLGMFYNLFLPGGIGGDAYKVLLLRRRNNEVSTRLVSAAVLLDRISGVAGLGILLALIFGLLFKVDGWGLVLILAIVPGLIIFYQVVKKWFPSFLRSFYPTFYLGVGVQLLQVFCVLTIMWSINIRHDYLVFQGLFLLSSIVAIFPFTIGGLGARELVFLWGAHQFMLEQHEAVFISLLFYLITVVVSLAGIIWTFRSPFEGNWPPSGVTR